jgi:hypothetical protein
MGEQLKLSLRLIFCAPPSEHPALLWYVPCTVRLAARHAL